MNQTTPDPSQTWRGQRVAVVGLARSGIAACRFLERRGARVLATDRRSPVELGERVLELQADGIETSLGADPDLTGFDAIVLSPGVDPSQDFIVRARAAGVSILPELELGAREIKGRLVCITGTKGKSTTTMGLYAMLREGGLDAHAVGNIGEPITAHIDGSDERTVFVAEASSFQLETTQKLRPDCAIFLNLFPDHLDRHPTFEAYKAAKARIFAHQTPTDTAIVNRDDEAVFELASHTRAQVIPFTPKGRPEKADPGPMAGFENGDAVFQDGQRTTLFSGADVQIPGSAVRANLLAAATAAHHFGISSVSIRKAVREFRGVPHTFEKLGQVCGVDFFNDSKATTIESVRVALESFDSPVLAIMGGRLKAGSFGSLRDTVSKRVRAIYAIGESRPLIQEAFADVCAVHDCESLDEAVQKAHEGAQSGDVVLLAPGCSSFDMFKDYAERGDAFRKAFHRLSQRGAA